MAATQVSGGLKTGKGLATQVGSDAPLPVLATTRPRPTRGGTPAETISTVTGMSTSRVSGLWEVALTLTGGAVSEKVCEQLTTALQTVCHGQARPITGGKRQHAVAGRSQLAVSTATSEDTPLAGRCAIAAVQGENATTITTQSSLVSTG